MIVLTEQIEIPASYEKLEAWTANFTTLDVGYRKTLDRPNLSAG